MGTCYYVICRDCKVVRDLDKFYALRSIATRGEALTLSKHLQDSGADSFRAALLISFMWEHTGHSCTVVDEHNEKGRFPPDGEPKEGHDFWKLTP